MRDIDSFRKDDPLPPTYFAPPGRATPSELEASAHRVRESDLVTLLLELFGSVIAVLNRERQIVAFNDGLLKFLGVSDPEGLLGLRPGEALHCVHAHDHPNGCGTSRFCSTCGAAIAIVLAQKNGAAEERECLLTIDRGRPVAVELAVRAVPFGLDGERLVLLLLRDIRGEKRRQALERVFLHDLGNSLQALAYCADRLKVAPPERLPALTERLDALVGSVIREVQEQRVLAQAEAGEYVPRRARVSARGSLEELRRIFEGAPAAEGRRLCVLSPEADFAVETDPVLVERVVGNMVKNALEATPPGGEVRLWCEACDAGVRWRVWNEGTLGDAVALRIFQRYFTTKAESGRGLGTFGMKLLAEAYLGGTVDFSTSSEGTVFTLTLPSVRPGQPDN